MLKELYQAIFADAVKSVSPKTLDLPGGKLLLVVPGESSIQIDKDDVQCHDRVSSFDSMTEWCSRYEEDKLVVQVHGDRVFVSANRTSPTKLNTVRFDLVQTKALSDLIDWMNRPRTQSQVVAGLRTSLSGTFDPSILPIFRRLDFQRKNDGSKTVSHTGESLGKSVEARAQTASGEIPDNLIFDLNLYSNVSTTIVTLRFALDVDAVNELIRIAPVGDTLNDAFRSTGLHLVQMIKQDLPKALVILCD